MTSLRSRVKDNRPLRAGLFLAQNAWYGTRSLLPDRAPRPVPAEPGPHHELAAMVRVKDEARFLPEWIAHHVNLGVGHVFVYDNNSTDGIAGVLAPFVERGLATVVPWPTVPASPGAEIDFLHRFGPACTWVAFFDADELLFETEPGALATALRTYADRPAIAVNWRYYGSSGHETIPPGLVTERFDRADALYNRHVKVIARPAMITRHRNSHNFYYRRGRLAVTAEGRRMLGSFITPPTAPPLVLHHYIYRSREDYDRKTRRGFVDASGAKERARQIAVADEEFHRRNDVAAPPPAATTRATAELLARLGYPAEIHGLQPEAVES
jgi:hypothetical protein